MGEKRVLAGIRGTGKCGCATTPVTWVHAQSGSGDGRKRNAIAEIFSHDVR